MEIDSTNSGSATAWPTGWTDIIAFRNDATSPWTPIKTTKVVSVKKAFISGAPYYKYDNRCSVKITLQDDSAINFDAQDVSNQSNWNDGSEADLNQAVDDIGSWI